MKRQPRVLAGTALGLLMASAPLGASPLQGNAVFGPLQHTAAPLILVQDDPAADGQQTDQELPRKKKHKQAEQAPVEQQAAPAAEQPAPAVEEQQPRKKKHEQQQTEQAPAEQAAPAEEQQPRKKKRDQQQQIEAAPAEQAAPAAEQIAPAVDEQQPKPRKKKRDQQQQIEAAPADQPAEQAAPATEEQPLKPRKKKRDQQQLEAAPAEQPAQQPVEQVAPTEEAAPANDNNPRKKKHKQDQQQIEAAPAEQAPATKVAPAGEPVPQAEPLQPPAEQQAAPAEGEQPKKHGKKPVGEQPVTGEQQPAAGEQQPATGEQQPANAEQPAQGEKPAQGEAVANPDEAPILDSQKDAKRKHRKDQGGQNAEGQSGQDAGGQTGEQPAQGGTEAQNPKPAPVDQGPPPTDDKAAQQEIKPEKIVPVTEEKGTRVDRAPDENVRDRRRPKGVDVLKEIGDRVIIQFNNQTIVESNDGPRMNRGAKDVYYEDLPRGRTRETVVRANGVQIVTIRNRNGDVIQRSRITPDGREYVLSYVDERSYDDDTDWRDPGDDLPPMRLTIPRREYILDSEDVESDDDYYDFLEQPPVEKVQRLYSVDEVKRSARVRDIARRVDLDTLNFEFGSATVSDTEVQKLEGVASAMEKLLKKNPAETFLIEGHTDAVGTPVANLALSDRRAEAVAEALTNAFGIPPENLTTQGYGEEYLKVDTPAPNRENRRVAIRRITSLVAPVASNN